MTGLQQHIHHRTPTIFRKAMMKATAMDTSINASRAWISHHVWLNTSLRQLGLLFGAVVGWLLLLWVLCSVEACIH